MGAKVIGGTLSTKTFFSFSLLKFCKHSSLKTEGAEGFADKVIATQR